MFQKSLAEVFTLKSLKNAFGSISSKAAGLDGVSLSFYKDDLDANLQTLLNDLLKGRYRPEPFKQIALPKDDGSLRPIGIGALSDKIIQKTLAEALRIYFEPLFSDRSYGFRTRKSTLDAVNRVNDALLKGNVYVLRTDIDNFFERVEHRRLLGMLSGQISDTALLNLLSLMLTNGSFERYRYIENREEIHQGDPLSPLLSNIYLNEMDWYLEEQGVTFVRYVDDLVIMAHSFKEMQQHEQLLYGFLGSLDLSVNVDKTKQCHAIKEGFDYLGLFFKGFERSISKSKFDDTVFKLHETIKRAKSFEEMINILNQYLQGLNNYYLKIISETHPQMKLLQDAILMALSARVSREKKRGIVTTKGAFNRHLEMVVFPFGFSKIEKKDFITRIIARGFESVLADKSYKKAKNTASKTKQKYAKKFATASTIYINEPGTALGISKNTIVLKQKGRLVYKIPKTQCERIIIANKGISLSSNVVEQCAKLHIAIDFIATSNTISTPYASLFSANHAYANMTLLQEAILNTPHALKLAKAFIKGKSKNQLNYLKLLERHHKGLELEIEKMEHKIKQVQTNAQNVNELMGFEGQIAMLYWQALAKIVDSKVDFTHRHTHGADDLVNSVLNYGYAILYGRVHYHAVKAGLSINISYLHALDGNKPTLIYDMIEEFRAFVVDRTIFSMINNREPLKLDDKNKLDLKSRQLIAKNVLEKLGSYTRHKKASKKIDTIISEQAYLLVRDIQGLSTYKPFIGKY